MKNNLPEIYVGTKCLRDVNKALRQEWVVTNGLGGYASSTVLGVNTRKYHGFLVAAFNPPVDRRVLLFKLDEEIVIENECHPIGLNEFEYGLLPRDYSFLSYFLMNPFPTYRYSVHNVQLEKTVFMVRERNATVIRYWVCNPHNNRLTIRITPLVNSRHFHSITRNDCIGWNFIQKLYGQGVILEPSIPLSSLLLYSSSGRYVTGEGEWVEKLYFQEEANRGESCLDDEFRPGFFEVEVDSKETKHFHLIVTAGKNESEVLKVFSSLPETNLKDGDALYSSEVKRQQSLIDRFQKRYRNNPLEDWLKWLVLSTDSFIVRRKSTKTKSVIAGYPWFEDWGRDALISLAGLTLITDRFEDAQEILLTFTRYC